MPDPINANKNFLERFNDITSSLEDHIVAALTDSSADLEVILKELLIYLNAASQNLGKIQERVDHFYYSIEPLKSIPEKVNDLEKELIVLPQSIRSVLNEQSLAVSSEISSLRSGLQVFTKSLSSFLKGLSESLKENKTSNDSQVTLLNNLDTSVQRLIREVERAQKESAGKQDNLVSIIDQLLKNKGAAEAANTDVAVKKIETEASIKKTKLNFWVKVLGYVIGSGGLVYFLFNILKDALAK